MEHIQNILKDMTPLKALKLAGIVLGVLLLLSVALAIVSATFGTFTGGFRDMGFSIAPTSAIEPSYGMYAGGKGAGGIAYDSGSVYMVQGEAAMPTLSARNVSSTIYPPTPSAVGADLEKYEITQYQASIETRRLKDTCDKFTILKAREDVIFESSNAYKTGCSFTFKVKHTAVAEVLAWLKALNPRELSENTYTIKQQIDDFTKEIDVLTKKRQSIDETLESALNAYDEITRVATNSNNADALAQIINSKIAIIERLTQERININEQLDRYARAKADQLDRLDYTYFNVSVTENKYIDGDSIRESWKQAMRNFVWNFNARLQDLTINMILILLVIVQWILYAVLALFVAKYGWKFAKKVWTK